jgi:DHA1 family multidrug resistance protein-like MFS transporter
VSAARAASLLPSETWRRNQIAVCIAAGLLFFGFTLAMPFLPFFIASLGVEGSSVEIWSGITLFTAPFLAALMGPVWGRMTDRYGMKIMVQRIVIAMTLHWVLMYFVSSIAHLLVLRVMLGVFSGFGTISVALVTHGVPKDKIGGVVGTLQSVQILSAALGPALGGFLFDHFGLRPVFLITAAICAVGFVLVTAAYREIGPGESGALAADEQPLPFRRIVAIPGILPLVALLFFVNLVDRSFGLIVPLFLEDLVGPGPSLGSVSGLIISGGAFASAISAIWLGQNAGKGRPLRWMRLSLATGSVLLLGLAFVRGMWDLTALRLAFGLASGGLLTLGYAVASHSVGDRSRATTFGFLSGGAMMGGAVGPLAAGVLAPVVGFRGFFGIGAGLFLVLAFLSSPPVRRERERARAGEVERPYMPLPR